MANTQYRKNLLDIAQASKNYTDKVAQEILWKIGEYDITTQTDNTSALVKTAPSGATRVKIKRISGNCVKYAPSTASDDSVAQIKVIPENTYTTELNILGGMSYKSENFIIPTMGVSSQTLLGVTMVNNRDGSLTFDGTSTADQYSCFYQYYRNTSSFPNGIKAGDTVYFKLFGDTSNLTVMLYTYKTSWTQIIDNASKGYVQIPSDATGFIIRVGCYNNKTFNNQVVYPMLVSGTTEPTEFKQGFDGIRDSAVTNFIVSGSNLANIPNNTISSGGYLFNIPISNLGIGTYTVSFNWTGGMSLQFRALKNNVNVGSNTINDTVSGINSLTITTTDVPDTIYLYSNNSSGGTASDIMLNKGSTALPYVPYIAPITKTIPQEIQALEGYGWGINDTCYNYINLNTKKFIQTATKYTITSSSSYLWISESFQYATLNVGNTFKLGGQILIVGNDNIAKGEYANNGNIMFTFKNAYANQQELKDDLLGVIILFELGTPIETDISSYLPTDFNKIATNDNYTDIEFVSEYGYDIPNKISFYGTIKETLCTAINKNNTLAVSLTNNEAKYGWSAGSVANVRDYTTNKGNPKVNRVDLSSLTWVWHPDSSKFYSASLVNDIKATTIPLSNNYDCSLTSTDSNNTLELASNGYLWVKTDGTQSTRPSGYFYYELAEEIPEDITPLDNNVIEVVENDELEFVNSENQAVPSEITYRIEVEK